VAVIGVVAVCVAVAVIGRVAVRVIGRVAADVVGIVAVRVPVPGGTAGA
jgi:hypothetical protein